MRGCEELTRVPLSASGLARLGRNAEAAWVVWQCGGGRMRDARP